MLRRCCRGGRRKSTVFFFLTIRPPPRSPLFPYTTLFRSRGAHPTGPCRWFPSPPNRRPRCRRRRGSPEGPATTPWGSRSEEHTSELQSRQYLVCRLLLEKKKYNDYRCNTQSHYSLLTACR